MNKSTKNKILKWLLGLVIVVVLLIVSIILIVRSPWGQDFIVSKATDFISKKTNTKISIDKFFLTFSGNIYLEGFYIEDIKGDTLLFSKELEADIPLGPIISSSNIFVNSLEWKGFVANIKRPEKSQTFNYQFLLDAFAGEETTTEKDTISSDSNLTFGLGSLLFEDFNLSYLDDFGGIDARLQLGTLTLNVDDIDLDQMHFDINKFKISDTNISYVQKKAFSEEETTTDTTSIIPLISLNDFQLNNIKLNYKSDPDQISSNIEIGHFQLGIPQINLGSNTFELSSLVLNDSNFKVSLPPTPSEEVIKETPSTHTPFQWPDYNFKLDELNLERNNIALRTIASDSTPDVFTETKLKAITLAANDLNYKAGNAGLTLDKFSLSGPNGLNLNNLSLKISVDNKSSIVQNIKVSTKNSRLNGSLSLKYNSLNELLNLNENIAVSLKIPEFQLSSKDLLAINPSLSENVYLQSTATNLFTGDLNIDGNLTDLNVNNLDINWGPKTYFKLVGSLSNVLNTNNLSFDLKDIAVGTSRDDLLNFFSEDEFGISIPDSLRINSMVSGTLNNIATKTTIIIPEGIGVLDLVYSDLDRQGVQGNLQLDSLNLGAILGTESLGKISLKATLDAAGSNLGNLDANFASNISQIGLNAYNYTNIDISGKIHDGNGTFNFASNDPNLNLNVDGKAILDSVNSKVNINANLMGADLYAMGFTANPLKTAVKANVNFQGNAKSFDLNLQTSEGLVVANSETHSIQDLSLKALISPKATTVDVNSSFLTAHLEGNSDPGSLFSSLEGYINSHFSDSVKIKDVTQNTSISLKAKLHPSSVTKEVFLNGLVELDTVSLVVNFEEKLNQFDADFKLPHANYGGTEIDEMQFTINGTDNDVAFKLDWAALNSGPVQIKQTILEGKLHKKEITLDFSAFDEKEILAHIKSKILIEKDSTELSIEPSSLVLNKKNWTIPANNKVTFLPNEVNLEDFKFAYNNQSLNFSNKLPDITNPHIGIEFNNFKLQSFLSYLNPDESLASGLIQGKIVVENPFDAYGLLADIGIEKLKLKQIPVGGLSLKANSINRTNYDFNMALHGGAVEMDLNGGYVAKTEGPELNLSMNLDKFDLSLVKEFATEQLKDASGYLSGNFKINGTLNEPIYSGDLVFNSIKVQPKLLNTTLALTNSSIKIDNAGLYFDDFKILDANSNIFAIKGKIETKNLTNPTFNLKLTADNFEVLNATKEDNPLIYGAVNLGMNLTIGGNLNLPKIGGKFKIGDKTDLTFIVPESQLDVQERDGVVIFVNKENPDNILSRTDEASAIGEFKGMDVNVIMEVTEKSIFNVIINEDTGDNLSISGNAGFNLNITPNGLINLSGQYELINGHYEVSLYNLVNRRFDIAKGSTITWDGDPYDAVLDVTAIYNVETSAAPLMNAVTSSSGASESSKYRQILPFSVKLNIDGRILSPELSFGLDMPDADQGALGGAVYTSVQQLNDQETELNKQVFSLLALNRFFPTSGNDGSSGGAVALARDNVNQLLSNELNVFADKVLGQTGLELDFGLDSFTDYQGESPEDRTQLNINAKKKLFNDRLIVSAGSTVDVEGSAAETENEAPIIGNISLEYLLSESGRYRLKGFRKNEFDNIIDGQLILTGFAFILNQEFNTFKELFNPVKNKSTNEDQNIKKSSEPKSSDKK